MVEEEGGALVRKTYSFEGYRVRLQSKTPWAKLDDPLDLKALIESMPERQLDRSKREMKSKPVPDRSQPEKLPV